MVVTYVQTVQTGATFVATDLGLYCFAYVPKRDARLIRAKARVKTSVKHHTVNS